MNTVLKQQLEDKLSVIKINKRIKEIIQEFRSGNFSHVAEKNALETELKEVEARINHYYERVLEAQGVA